MWLTLRRWSRRFRRVWLKLVIVYIVLFFTWDTCRLVLPGKSAQRPAPSEPSPSKERYFIASIHWNNEEILYNHWNRAVLDLVKHLGVNNTYVAVLESGSWDNSKGALEDLEASLSGLGVPHSIISEETTHQDEISRTPAPEEEGWIMTPRGKKELRRIPYLAKLRNKVMAEMTKPNVTQQMFFNKVIWLNDVIFTTEDVVNLLSTNYGEYSAACSLDFSKPPMYYDTFALRDIDGNKAVTQTWPYFLSSVSRRALLSNVAVPVQSCWNGMVAMDTKPFYANSPINFRGIPDTLAEYHLEGSECCLIHADNPLTYEQGVWLNPNVRVGYNQEAYDAVHQSADDAWPSSLARVKGLWYNRFSRWIGMPKRVFERLSVESRLRKWLEDKPFDDVRYENGKNCLINEMQVLVENGWKHL